MDKGGSGEIVSVVCKSLGLKKPIVIGYDWGAAIALKMAIINKECFKRLLPSTLVSTNKKKTS